MWGVLTVIAGLWLVITGLIRKRRQAIAYGIGLFLITAWDFWVLYRATTTSNDAAIRVDLVILIPLAIYLFYQGNKVLKKEHKKSSS